jgi:hypothetical protein
MRTEHVNIPATDFEQERCHIVTYFCSYNGGTMTDPDHA